MPEISSTAATILDPSLLILAGVAVGALAGWWLMRGKAREWFEHGRAEARGESEAERATLSERLAGAERQVVELRSRMAEADNLCGRMRDDLNQQSNARAAAEVQAGRVVELEQALAALRGEHSSAQTRIADLQARIEDERRAAGEKLALLDQARVQLADAFKALSSQALRDNNQSFIELAKSTLEKFQEGAKGDLTQRQQAIDAALKPIRESLEKVGGSLGELEKARLGAYVELKEQVRALATGQGQLQQETRNLVTALRAPAVRGRWGEIQLKRVVELAGMLDHCDFTQQETFDGASSDDGKLRPDLVVKLPGGKSIAVDAKAPLAAYLASLEVEGDQRAACLRDHARQIRDHLTKLSAKAYWERLSPTPEFVVLFLPGETFFSAALEADPSLIEAGVEAKVILATPTTLIALLRAVAYGWRQEQLAANAQQVAELGGELHARLRIFVEHLNRMRNGLESAVDSYNKGIGSLETRVLVSARKLKELGAGSGEEIEGVEAIDKAPRTIQGADGSG